jgi:murein DD-endopeptidase MepM/ murein hydrolase activator NlpD
MARNQHHLKRLLILLLTLFTFCYTLFLVAPTTRAEDITELQEQIKKQQELIQQLEKQKQIYQEKIELKRKEAVNLKNQLNILTNQILATQLEIQEKEETIKETELKIKSLQIVMQEKQSQIDKIKKQIGYVIKLLNKYENKSYLEILLLNNSISDFFNQINYIKSLEKSLQNNLEKMKIIKSGLELQEKDLRTETAKLAQLKDDLVWRRNELRNEKMAKNRLLEETQGAEWKFQTLLAEAVREQKMAEREIAAAEAKIRQKLAEEQEKKLLEQLEEGIGPMIFSWPVPQNVITCFFHDPEYPYRQWLGEHSGIDIRAEQGTAVRAAASGYVAKAKDGGLGYSYVMLIHANGFATIYGHLSQIYVKEDEIVKRGDIIGRSGGIPGTPGAGRFSTGPHLHFEVRLNGLPVNPLEYLIK